MFGTLAVGMRSDPLGAFVLASLGIYPVSVVGVALHEGTHALVARLLGWRVYAIALGRGDVSSQLRVGGTRLVFRRSFFRGGHCVAAPKIGDPSRRAIALFLGAPVLMHVVVAAVAFRLASGATVGGMIATMFALSNALLALLNAWPRHVSRDLSTDGMVLLDLLRSPETALVRWRFSARLLAIQHERKPEEGLAAAEQALALEPQSEAAAACLAVAAQAAGRGEEALRQVAAYARTVEAARPKEILKLPERELAARGHFRGSEHEEYMRGSILVGLDRLDEVLALSERGVARATSEETRALWQGCVALSLLMAERDPDRAEEAARYAYERVPWVPFVEVAWGMARIERGDVREGLAAFSRASRIDPEATAQLRAAWTVVARAAEGRPERAIPAELQAPAVWPACRRRAERALAR